MSVREQIQRTAWELGMAGISIIVGILCCRVCVAQCYPLIPIAISIGCLSNWGSKRTATIAVMVFFSLLSVDDAVKYGMILICILIVNGLVRWWYKELAVQVSAAIAAVTTVWIGIGGNLLELIPRQEYVITILEGVVAYFGILSLGQIRSFSLGGRNWRSRWEKKEEVREQELWPEVRERLHECVASFQDLSKIFAQIEPEQKQEETEHTEELLVFQAGQNGCMECIQRQARRNHISWYRRITENREAMALQFNAIAGVLEQCLQTEHYQIQKEDFRMEKMQFKLHQHGVRVHEQRLWECPNGRWQIKVLAQCSRGNFMQVKEVAQIISRCIGRTMVPTRDMKALLGKDTANLYFEEDTSYQEVHGVARITKDGAGVSGDNFSVLPLENGKCAMSLSDGMGSGLKACQESEMVIDLLERFLEAGFTEAMALSMTNSTMVLRGMKERFTTVDLTTIDLYSGKCELFKVGAAATFIGQQGNYEYILSENLPTGASCQIELEPVQRQLHSGDFVVMMTDGVLEHLQVEEPEETMCEILASIHSNNPMEMARKILERVLFYTQGRAKDDMTVLCLGIWEKS